MNSNDRLKASRMLAVWLLIWMIPALDVQGVGRVSLRRDLRSFQYPASV